MTTIGLCHYQVGGTDGVSLEMDKWRQVLEGMGHAVHLCGGGGLGTAEGFLIEELYHHREDVERITRNAFYRLSDYESEADLEKEVLELADRIERGLRAFIDEFFIELLIPNNIWSVGVNLPAAVAFSRVVRELGIPAVAHHHDFYWETFRGMVPTCEVARNFASEYLPPNKPLVTHVVINSLVQAELRKRNGVESTVVPNVFDFAGDPWGVDDYNYDFRETIGVNENDVVVLQATRIVERKGIELAIDLVRELNKPDHIEKLRERGLYDGRRFSEESRIVLVLAGYSEDRTNKYLNRLKEKIGRAGIEVRFISDVVLSRRGEIDGWRIYSLWDCYVFADLVTYPSLFEGWGNQFLEAIRANLPLVLFEYPVFRSDIAPLGFRYISLGSEAEADEATLVRIPEAALQSAAREAVQILTSPDRYQEMVERNFDLGNSCLSLTRLRELLGQVVAQSLS